MVQDNQPQWGPTSGDTSTKCLVAASASEDGSLTAGRFGRARHPLLAWRFVATCCPVDDAWLVYTFVTMLSCSLICHQPCRGSLVTIINILFITINRARQRLWTISRLIDCQPHWGWSSRRVLAARNLVGLPIAISPSSSCIGCGEAPWPFPFRMNRVSCARA